MAKTKSQLILDTLGFNVNHILFKWQATATLATIYGICNALDEIVLGEPLGRVLTILFGSMIFGTPVVLALVFIVLLLIRKKHLLYFITNIILMLGCLVSIISAIVAGFR